MPLLSLCIVMIFNQCHSRTEKKNLKAHTELIPVFHMISSHIWIQLKILSVCMHAIYIQLKCCFFMHSHLNISMRVLVFWRIKAEVEGRSYLFQRKVPLLTVLILPQKICRPPLKIPKKIQKLLKYFKTELLRRILKFYTGHVLKADFPLNNFSAEVIFDLKGSEYLWI